MPSTREIRRRIRSVKSTSQITRAMEMVSAVKMRRAQASVLASRPYSSRLETLLGTLAAHAGQDAHPLMVESDVDRVGIILITSDRGLCGPLNVNAVRKAADLILEYSNDADVITIGRRGRDWMARHGSNVVADFSDQHDRPSVAHMVPIGQFATSMFLDRQVGSVELVYNEFVSTTVQKPVRKRLLPVEPLPEEGRHFADFIYEPSPDAVLRELMPRYVDVLIYQALLESNASEHSARMVAMHNATENARDVIQQLTLNYNKARQSGITSEILEIASGAGALVDQ